MTLFLSRDHYSPGERGIDDFANDIITRRAGSDGAVLDTGFREFVSDPDFATSGYGADYAAAAESCAIAIRRNARGECARGRAPYECLLGYDLRYRLMPHWERKGRFQVLGVDPNQVIQEVRASETTWSDWPLEMSWSARGQAARHMEFFFRLVVAVQERRMVEGNLAPSTAIEEAIDEIDAEIDHALHLPMNETLAARLRERLTEALQPAAPALEI